jgi:hypothetical protein
VIPATKGAIVPNGIFPVPPVDVDHHHDVAPRLALRLRTRWRRRRLDQRLAAGANPAQSAELELRAAQLGASTERARIADALVKVTEDARRPAAILRLEPHRAEIRSSTDALLALALRLRDRQPVAIQGAAMAALLVTPGASPLDPDSGASLRQAVRAAHAALEITPRERATPIVRRVAHPTLTATR